MTGFRSTFFKTSLFFVNGMFITHIVLDQYMEFLGSAGESMLPTLNVNRDYLLISKAYKFGKGIRFGDVVACTKPTDPMQKVCKRVTGTEGDYVLVDPSKASIMTNLQEYLDDDVMQSKLAEMQRNNTKVARTLSDFKRSNDQTDSEEKKLKLAGLSDADLDDILQTFENTLLDNATYEQKTNKYYNQYIKVPKGHCWLTGDNLSNSIDSRSYNCVPVGLIVGKVVGKIYIGNALLPWTWRYQKTENLCHEQPKVEKVEL